VRGSMSGGLFFHSGSDVLRKTDGTGLYQWRVDEEAMRRTDAGRSFWAYATTVPPTLLTLAAWLLRGIWEIPETVVAGGCGHYASRQDWNLLVLHSVRSEANAGRDRIGNQVSNGFPMDKVDPIVKTIFGLR